MRRAVRFCHRGRLALLGTLGLAGLVAAGSGALAAELAELVQAHGLSPIDPPRAAADFTLPLLTDGELSLSELRDRWVLLTFWASWCAPCRIELPSLERLHRSRGEAEMAVLGVALDRELVAARRLAEELGLSFPSVWDGQGGVGAIYQASAIPVSYLIDPHGRIVGLARGARDWTHFGQLIDTLTTAGAAPSAKTATYAEAVALPEVLGPPTAELQLSDPTPLAGQEFFLDIRLRWSGRLDDYLPRPPKVHLPAGVRQDRVTASTDSRAGAREVLYRVSLRADQEGQYALDPIELRYTPRLATSEAVRRLTGPTVDVRARSLAGLKPSTAAWVASAVLLLAASGLVLHRRRRTSATAAVAPRTDDLEAMETRFLEARGLRVQGDGKGFALAMLELGKRLGAFDDLQTGDVSQLEEGLHYGGRVPSAEELDRLERACERQLQALRPDSDAAARQSLRLRNDRS